MWSQRKMGEGKTGFLREGSGISMADARSPNAIARSHLPRPQVRPAR
jgi:hypothetical protein